MYGSSLQNYLIGILVPNKEPVVELANELKIEGDFEEICKNKEVNKVILKDLEKLGREKKVFLNIR